MFSHLLFASDLSSASEAAFRQVRELAVPFRAKVTLLYVCETLGGAAAGLYDLPMPAALQELESALETTAQARLTTWQSQLRQARIESEVVIAQGHPGLTIVATAERIGSDLTVMGSRGLGPVRSLLLGSTSTYVLHHSHCPMLILPAV